MKLISRNDLFGYLNNSSTNIVVAISENLSGHRINYLKALSNKLEKKNEKILLILESQLEFELDFYQKAIVHEIDFLCIENFGQKREILDYVQSLVKTANIRKILFWDGDNWTKHLIFFEGKPQILFIRPYLTSKRMKNILNYSAKWLAIFYFHYVRNFRIGILGVPLHSPRLLKSRWFDDPILIEPNNVEIVDNQISILENVVFHSNTNFILIPGFLTSRKNPKLAIDVLQRVLRKSEDSVVLIFAGKADEFCRKMIKASSNQALIHIDRYLSADEYREILAISKVVLLPYSNKGSSGIVLESLAQGKNVIITKSKVWLEAEKNSNGQLHLIQLNAEKIAQEILSIFQSRIRTNPVVLSGTNRPTVIDFLVKDEN